MLKILVGVVLGFLLFTSPGARQTTADVLRFAADALAPEVEGPTLQERIGEVLKDEVLKEENDPNSRPIK